MVQSKKKRHVDTKNLQKVRKLKKKRQFKAGALPLQMQVFIWIVSRFPTVQVTMHESLKRTSKPLCPSP